MKTDDYPILHLADAINKLIEDAGPEWSFMMGSSYIDKESDRIEGSPRRIYWATMSTHILYSGGYARSVSMNEGYLHIVNAEKHYSFEAAIRDLISLMKTFLGNPEKSNDGPNSQAEEVK